jgi:nucleotide-binding universal stress UspA family protein
MKGTFQGVGNFEGVPMTTNPKEPTGQVIVAVDGSPSSLEALRQGHRMATALGHPVVAVNVWQGPHYGLNLPQSWHPERDAKELLASSIRTAFEPQAAPDIEAVTANGDPADTLIRLSRGADLLVMGSRGHSGITGVMGGSVSNICAAHAHCPVLIVHAPANDAVSESHVEDGSATNPAAV